MLACLAAACNQPAVRGVVELARIDVCRGAVRLAVGFAERGQRVLSAAVRLPVGVDRAGHCLVVVIVGKREHDGVEHWPVGFADIIVFRVFVGVRIEIGLDLLIRRLDCVVERVGIGRGQIGVVEIILEAFKRGALAVGVLQIGADVGAAVLLGEAELYGIAGKVGEHLFVGFLIIGRHREVLFLGLENHRERVLDGDEGLLEEIVLPAGVAVVHLLVERLRGVQHPAQIVLVDVREVEVFAPVIVGQFGVCHLIVAAGEDHVRHLGGFFMLVHKIEQQPGETAAQQQRGQQNGRQHLAPDGRALPKGPVRSRIQRRGGRFLRSGRFAALIEFSHGLTPFSASLVNSVPHGRGFFNLCSCRLFEQFVNSASKNRRASGNPPNLFPDFVENSRAF